MRFLLIFFILFYIPLSFADQAMNEKKMMEVQECFSNIDQSNFAALEARGKEMEQEINRLCSSGKRDEAMKTAMKYGKEFSDSPEYQEIRKCSELMAGMMANMPMPFVPPEVDDNNDGENGHICDGM